LISQQEHEAWEVLLACQGQIRLAPSGHIIGIDMGAALRIGTACGSDRVVLSELLPAGEAGLVEAVARGSDETNAQFEMDSSPTFLSSSVNRGSERKGS
jgi:hypothetical protein